MGERYKIAANNTINNDKKVKLIHNLPNTWSKDDSNHWKLCSVCNERQDETEHTWDNGKVTKLATCTEAGTKLYTCTKCNKMKEETIEEALGHSYTEDNVESTETALGGTFHKCLRCNEEYWTNFNRNSAYNQTLMPNLETIYHYCTHNNLAAETTVNIADGKKLKVFLQDPLGILKKDKSDVLGIDVKYISEGSARYNELMSQVDDDYPIEHINFFEVCPTINGVPVTGNLDGSVYMEYEIPEGWDESDLEMILVRDSDDQEFDEKVLEIDSKRYLAMWKNHFSPYAMIDKLSDEEKAALESLNNKNGTESDGLNSQQEEKNSEDSPSDSTSKTGDEITYFAVSGLGLIMTLALGLMLNSKINKKKSSK